MLRYLLLTEKILNDWYPGFEELKQFLADHDIVVSARTLQRDIRKIRNDFGIEILYDHNRRGYAIHRDNDQEVLAFLRFMGMARTADILVESLADGHEHMRHIHFDSVHLFNGREHIKTVIQAVRDRRLVGFTHQRFERNSPTHVILRPYFLREYQYRWYLVGIPEAHKTREPKNYGLDRISRIDILPQTFERTDEDYVREKYYHTVGLNFSAGKPENVLVRCTVLTGKYLQSLPIHPSQEILKKGNTHWTVRFKVVPNFEFEQKLLMHLYQIEVLSPDWFVRAFKNNVFKAATRLGL